MCELDEPCWAVISARGREATGISYVEAVRVVRELAARKLSGLCVVTAAAAARLGVERLITGDSGEAKVRDEREVV